MSFIQVMEFETDDIDTIERLSDRWLAKTEGKRTLRREIIARDRRAPNNYVVVVFFDSYESAMINSNLPETNADAEEYQSLTAGTLTFRDLDVIRDIAD